MQDTVAESAVEAVVQEQPVVLGNIRVGEVGRARTDEGDVPNLRVGCSNVRCSFRRLVCHVRINTVPLAQIVTSTWVLDGEPELVSSGVSLVDVERVILTESNDHMAGVHCSSEELDTVVLVRINLDVIDFGAGADSTEGEAVDFVVSREIIAAVTDGNVAEDTAVGSIVLSKLTGCTGIQGYRRNHRYRSQLRWRG